MQMYNYITLMTANDQTQQSNTISKPTDIKHMARL